MHEPTTLLTVGRLADLAGIPIHRVRYLLLVRGLRPIARAGHSWVYGPDVLERLRAEVRGDEMQDKPSEEMLAERGRRP